MQRSLITRCRCVEVGWALARGAVQDGIARWRKSRRRVVAADQGVVGALCREGAGGHGVLEGFREGNQLLLLVLSGGI